MSILLMCPVLYACGAHATPSPEILLERIYRFDVACRASKADPDKKVCSQEKSRAFTEFIQTYPGKSHSELIKSEIALSKDRVARFESLKDLKSVDAAAAGKIQELAQQTQNGDKKSAAELKRIGADALPALLELEHERGLIPSPLVIQTLSSIELSLDMTDAGLAGISAPVRDALILREQNYQRTLKRIALVQQGAHRNTPPWIVYAYMFGIGFIPFAIGLCATVVCMGRFDIRAFALLLACYLAYAGAYAWFTFRAPFV